MPKQPAAGRAASRPGTARRPRPRDVRSPTRRAERLERRDLAVQVDGDDGPGPRCDRASQRVGVDEQVRRRRSRRAPAGAGPRDRLRGGDERVRGHDHLVAGADARAARSAISSASVPLPTPTTCRAGERGVLVLELVYLRPEHERAGVTHLVHRVEHLVPDLLVLHRRSTSGTGIGVRPRSAR